MPVTNEPSIIQTKDGNVSVEVEIQGSNKGSKTIPIVQLKITISPGQVDDPETLFKIALEQTYAAALGFIHSTAEETDQVCIYSFILLFLSNFFFF